METETTFPTTTFNDHLIPQPYQAIEELLAATANMLVTANEDDLPVDSVMFRMVDHIDRECAEWRYEDGFGAVLFRVTWEKDVELRLLTPSDPPGVWFVTDRQPL